MSPCATPVPPGPQQLRALPQPAGAAAAPLPPPEGSGLRRPARSGPTHLLPLLPLPSNTRLPACHEEGGEPSWVWWSHGAVAGQGSCCLLPGERNHRIIKWFWWEGTLKTSRFHPCLWARVLGYGLGHGVSSMLGRGSHITTTCALSPASDLHEPMPEPGPTELQRLEAALHQTSRSVQVSPDCGSKRSQCSPTEPVGCLNSFWELLTKPHVLLPPSLLLNHLLESWESSSKKVGVRCGTGAVVGWDSVPVLL